MERTEYEIAPDGRQIPRSLQYTELATGLHYRNEQGEWVESKEEIELLPNGAGAVARQGQHKVYFSPDIAGGEGIDLETSDGKRLRSRVLGLSYFDQASGEAVMLAGLKSSEGQLVAPNRAVYPDAFDGVLADVEYIYRLASFEQNIVLREQLPSPAEFGLNPRTTRLQVMTEFFDSPEPGRIADLRANGLTDEVLNFGEMKIGRGRAFSIGDITDNRKVPVIKHWVALESRKFLVEEVLLPQVAGQLNALPPRGGQASINPNRRGKGENVIAALKGVLPVRTARVSTATMRMAKANDYRPTGFVLDYTITLSSATNFTFKSDTTHYVSGAVNLSGVTTFEGGAIVKYAVSSSATITATNTVWLTDRYLPVIFTSRNDNSVGETISGSSGNPTTAYAGHIALDLTAAPASCVISNARFSYLSNAVAGLDIVLNNAQVIRCQTGFAANEDNMSRPTLRNVLIYRINTFINGDDDPGDTVIAENVTAHFCTNFLYDVTGNISLTNCLFVNVTNWQCVDTFTNSSVILNSDAGVFQTVNGGMHYLGTNNLYRNVGTTNINAELLAGLKRRTTYPPIAFTNLTSTYTALGPQAQRDTDIPDLGYHYDPLDYIFGKVTQNTDLTFAAGTAVGWFRHNQGWTHAGHGIHIADTKTLTFAGLATSPCYYVHQTAVQETLVGFTPMDAGPGGITGWATSKANQPYLNLKFTRFAGLPIYRNHIRDDSGAIFVTANHCEFYGGGLGGYVSSLAFTNCLLDRTGTWFSAGNTNYNEIFAFRNCTVRGGYFVIDRQSPNAGHVKVTILDTAFDDVDLDTDDPHKNTAALTKYDYNAFLSGADRTDPQGANDVVVSDFDWQTGDLGRFYIPNNSDLIDEGSRSAADAGLFHFTIKASQIKEGNELPGAGEPPELVDIGYHYVATLPQAAGAQAVFIRTDEDLQGTWKGTYGEDGYNVIQNASSYPAYASVSVTGNSAYTWAGSTSDARALQKAAASDRIAACWYASSSFTVTLNLTDDKYHRVAFYCLDWDGTQQRAQTIEIRDASTDALLETRSVSSFSDGKYLVWDIKGNVKVKFIRTGAHNAVLSGLFFATEDQVWIDTDGDGIPDYEEDTNGNGDVDSGETDWLDPDDFGFRVFITRPKNNSVIP